MIETEGRQRGPVTSRGHGARTGMSPFLVPRPRPRLQVQCVLFNTGMDTITRVVESLARAAELAKAADFCGTVSVRLGDCSPLPVMSPAEVAAISGRHGDQLEFAYEFFGGNLGSAAGHNRLARHATDGFILIQNPDVLVSPRLFETMLEAFATAGVGMVESRQLPIEHPKDYDPQSGVTSWAAMACAMIPASLFHALGGFDAESFFLYCDDVDLSWRLRLAGYAVMFHPGAVVFHDKRLTLAGGWNPSEAEIYYSAEAALLLAQKWGRPDLASRWLDEFDRSGNVAQARARAEFLARRDAGTLPAPVAGAAEVAEFIGTHYTRHRFDI